MDKETIIIASEDVEIIDASEYKEELSEHFGRVPDVAKPLLKGAKTVFSQIEKSLYTAPAFINAVKTAVPDVTLQAMLTDEQKQQIAKGALKLMTKKDGSLMANLISPETKKIVATHNHPCLHHRRHCRSFLRDAAGTAGRDFETSAGGYPGSI